MSLISFLPILVTGFGIYFLIKLRAFFLLHPIRTGKKMLRIMRDPSSRRALSLALAGTLGVGNIVGVAYGISVGGAGAVFWMLVSSIFSSVIKFSESTLAADSRVDGRGGMAYVISRNGGWGRVLGGVYAILCIMLSLTMGTALQAKSAVDTAAHVGIHPTLFSLIFTVLIVITALGGYKKIEGAVSILIPIATLTYSAACIGVIILNFKSVIPTLESIMRGAFNFCSMTGGVSAFLLSKTVKEGYARGLLSNEAGVGTSAMAEARSSFSEPCAVGLLGMCEVVFDTVILCTLTALAILVGTPGEIRGGGISIVIGALRPLLSSATGPLVCILITLFAYSTVVCWYFYASECLTFLSRRAGRASYIALFVFSTFVGFLLPEDVLISVIDYILFLMSVLTLFTLLKNSERIRHLSEQYGLLKKSDAGKGREAKRRH